MNTSEALLRAATYLKWFRDGAITVDTERPDDIGEIIVILEQIADQVDDTRPLERGMNTARSLGPVARQEDRTATTNRGLTEAQLARRACFVCLAEDRPMRPVQVRSDGSKLVLSECVDREACSVHALVDDVKKQLGPSATEDEINKVRMNRMVVGWQSPRDDWLAAEVWKSSTLKATEEFLATEGAGKYPRLGSLLEQVAAVQKWRSQDIRKRRLPNVFARVLCRAGLHRWHGWRSWCPWIQARTRPDWRLDWIHDRTEPDRLQD